jgi:indolepyruvate ferredoxin oxidoreductase alpha subunit
MGASIGSAMGLEKAHPEMHGQVVSVIGDSTFLHSGITGLLDVVYNKGATTTLILDNRTTAMTGHQDHPATGKTLSKEPTNQLDFGVLAKALGVKRVVTADPFDIATLQNIITEETAAEEPSVIITQRPCALLVREKSRPLTVGDDCIGCKKCMKLGCPALVAKETAAGVKIEVNDSLCTGCGLCAQLCPTGALKKAGENNE